MSEKEIESEEERRKKTQWSERVGECGREEISVQYITVNSTWCTFFNVFVVLLLKTDFSIQHGEFRKTLYQ